MKKNLIEYLKYCMDRIPYLMGISSILYLLDNKVIPSMVSLSIGILYNLSENILEKQSLLKLDNKTMELDKEKLL